MQEYSVDISEGIKIYENWEEKLCTPVFVVINNALTAIIIMEDVIRESARELISKLKYLGISDITLLTGDSSNKANHVASILGIKNVYSNCGYEDKVRIVNQLKENGTVMMIGDGVNDVLSMRAADVSISYVDSSCDIVKLLNQGSFVGRPSMIKVYADQSTGEIYVSGDVKIIAKGELLSF